MAQNASHTILYIVGSSHSGTTLLSLLLGAQENVTAIGETDVFSAEGQRDKPLIDRRCSCGASSLHDCSFWNGIEHQLRKQNQSLFALDLSSGDRKIFARDQKIFWTQIFAHITDHFIVDASKEIDDLSKMLKMHLPVVPVYLVRSPFGVIHSESKKGKSWWKEALGYLHYHVKARVVLHGRNTVRLQYEQLAEDPADSIRFVFEKLKYNPSAISLEIDPSHHHFLRGNKMMHKGRQQVIRDDDWKTEMPVWKKIAVFMIIWPLWLNWHHWYRFLLWCRTMAKG